VKFSELKSIGHNIADSLASGIGLMIGVYEMDVFGEAAKSPERYLLVDFIAGTSTGGKTSPYLAKAISLYAKALGDLCQRHGLTADAFRELTARYEVNSRGRRFVVTVQDQSGRRSIDEYRGLPGKRIIVRDKLGQVRTKRSQVSPESD
jgi:hypothetical protein